jgi:hypothetical protein
MSFIPQTRIEDRAAALWQRYRLTPGFDVERLLDHLGLSLLWEAISDDRGRILGQLIPDKRIVILNEHHLDALEATTGGYAATRSAMRSATGTCTPRPPAPAP